MRLAAALLVFASRALADDQLALDPELQRELVVSEERNLEGAAAAAAADAAVTLRHLRSLMAASEADLESARAEVEDILRDPDGARRGLGSGPPDPVEALREEHEALATSGQLLAERHQDFLVKASSAALPVPDEEPARLVSMRLSYNARTRASDLARAERDAAAAAERLKAPRPSPNAAKASGAEAPSPGVQAAPPDARAAPLGARAAPGGPEEAPAVASLEGYAAELAEALKRLENASRILVLGEGRHAAALGATRESVERKARVLACDREDLEREASLLRAQLVLRKADRAITGR